MRRPKEDIRFLKMAQRNFEPLNLLVDFGNVVVQRTLVLPDGSWTEMPRERYHLCRPIPGAMEYLSYLVEALGRKHVFMCKGLPEGYDQELKQLIVSQLWRWVRINKFIEKTGVDTERVMFKTRSGKAQVCLENPGSWMVLDDRAEVATSFIHLEAFYGSRLRVIAVSPNSEEWRSFAPHEEWWPTIAESPREWWEAVVRLRKRQVELIKRGEDF